MAYSERHCIRHSLEQYLSIKYASYKRKSEDLFWQFHFVKGFPMATSFFNFSKLCKFWGSYNDQEAVWVTNPEVYTINLKPVCKKYFPFWWLLRIVIWYDAPDMMINSWWYYRILSHRKFWWGPSYYSCLQSKGFINIAVSTVTAVADTLQVSFLIASIDFDDILHCVFQIKR